MKKSTPSQLSQFLQYSRPWNLLEGILFYALGVGIVHYLGHPIDWKIYILGQACITMLQLSSYYLTVYYDRLFPTTPELISQNSKKENDDESAKELPRQVFQLTSLTTLTVGAVMTVLLLANRALNLQALLILGIAFFLAFFYAVPPLRLVYSGYGELSQAIFISTLVPAFAFLLQTGELHRLLPMLTFPLAALYLAMLLALSLKDYSRDLKNERKTLLVRLGWPHGMRLHNILIVATYILLLLAFISGMPWGLTWPGLLTLPLAGFQIWQFIQINGGAKPHWGLLSLTATGTLLLTTYLITFTLWTS
ncbi:MAG TPA: prenyltransferase [Anaerolineaceae bacterium]|nr:prenyltransferase [Anaerolineaceae bacterium]